MEDANYLIHLAKQMGFIEASFYNHMPNVTSCNTIKAIDQSHTDGLVILEMDDIYGMLILLGLGLVGSLAVFSAEVIPQVRGKLFTVRTGSLVKDLFCMCLRCSKMALARAGTHKPSQYV